MAKRDKSNEIIINVINPENETATASRLFTSAESVKEMYDVAQGEYSALKKVFDEFPTTVFAKYAAFAIGRKTLRIDEKEYKDFVKNLKAGQ